jgi:Flp pilus assembly pilin Flp
MKRSKQSNSKNNQSGQTLVEFILLLASITIISFSFLKAVNGNISDRWESLYNVILDDPNQKARLQ